MCATRGSLALSQLPILGEGAATAGPAKIRSGESGTSKEIRTSFYVVARFGRALVVWMVFTKDAGRFISLGGNWAKLNSYIFRQKRLTFLAGRAGSLQTVCTPAALKMGGTHKIVESASFPQYILYPDTR